MIKHGLIAAALISGLIQPALAALERYEVDPNHTYPSIEFPHMGISFWRGKFNKTSGAITIDRAAGTGEVEIVVDTSTINFGLAAMDEKARSEDFFDVARFPTAVYRGTLDLVEGKPRTVDGRVTIHGVTRPLKLDVKLFNCIVHPMHQKEVCGADAEGELNWSDFGMKMSRFGEGNAGKVLLRIQVEALKRD